MLRLVGNDARPAALLADAQFTRRGRCQIGEVPPSLAYGAEQSGIEGGHWGEVYIGTRQNRQEPVGDNRQALPGSWSPPDGSTEQIRERGYAPGGRHQVSSANRRRW